MKKSQISRKNFLSKFVLTATGILTFPSITKAITTEDKKPLDMKMVKEFVGKAHSDIDKVKQLYQEEPQLIYAAWDWGGGDFELGIGSASHVGHKELALFLLEKGAPMNLFSAAMLGKIEIVKTILTAFPNQLNARGPHGFTALHHAIKGKDDALEVKEYLEYLGAKETRI